MIESTVVTITLEIDPFTCRNLMSLSDPTNEKSYETTDERKEKQNRSRDQKGAQHNERAY